MNERIQQMIYSLNEKEGVHWTNEDKLKFAELIVRECADIAQQHNKSPIGAPLAVGYVIREHFGVEE